MLRLALILLLAAGAAAQSSPLELYRSLRSVDLDPQQVYRVRDGAFDLEEVHVTLVDGTIAFTRAVDGRVTGAFFEGEGDLLVVPPDNVERTSLALHTGAAILEERFTTAYFRFTDDLPARLEPHLREAEDTTRFLERWNPAARSLADGDALPLLVAFTRDPGAPPARYFRARLGGSRLGTFDLRLDSRSDEQIWLGQVNYANQLQFFDVWASFPMRSARRSPSATREVERKLRIPRFHIASEIAPPSDLRCQAALALEVVQGGDRVLLFELSRYLKVESVTARAAAPPAAEVALEFLQNEALRGTDLDRRGNDLVAVVLPQPLASGQKLELRFTYAGQALSEAGGGLMYVGARGIWYPNQGPFMAAFDLEFRHPGAWTLVATGKRTALETTGERRYSRWVSEQAIPVAGFNLGVYKSSSVRAANILVEAYAAEGMERGFPGAGAGVAPAPPARSSRPISRSPRTVAPPRPQPASHRERIAQESAAIIEFLTPRLGPLPFSSLAITQMPGPASQGWPGLIFLSSYVFLAPEQRRALHPTDLEEMLYQRQMQAHETAHQWWGDTVGRQSYRDQWAVEALANYSGLLALEAEHPADLRTLLARYREVLLQKNEQGTRTLGAGPVTLGTRLVSSKAPAAYDAVLYGRGTWLLHMLRHMLRDAARDDPGDPDTLFYRALRALLQGHAGREISTADLQRAFEAVLPRSLYFEDKPSLDWFFETWVNGASVPTLRLVEVRFTQRGGRAVATATLRQSDAPRDLVTSVPIYAVVGGKPQYVGRVFAEGEETALRLAVPAGANKLLLDPLQTVLRRD